MRKFVILVVAVALIGSLGIALPTDTVEPTVESVKATVAGAVYSRETETGLSATIRFANASITEVKTDPGTGLYKVKLSPGSYEVEISSKDYQPQSASLEVAESKVLYFVRLQHN